MRVPGCVSVGLSDSFMCVKYRREPRRIAKLVFSASVYFPFFFFNFLLKRDDDHFDNCIMRQDHKYKSQYKGSFEYYEHTPRLVQHIFRTTLVMSEKKSYMGSINAK